MNGPIKKIKVLYTIPNFDTAGSGKALLKIAQRLNPDYFQPSIACFHDGGSFFEIVKNSGIPLHIFQFMSPGGSRIQMLNDCWKISRELRELSPDLIHSFHYGSDYTEALAARMAGIKWVFTKKNMSWKGSSYNGWRLRSFLAHGIVAQNTEMLEQFFPDWRKVKLIPRGVDAEEFFPRRRAEHLLQEFDIQAEEKVVVVVANLVPVKGVETLIEAFSKMREAGAPPSRLLVVGEDRSDYGAELKDLTQRLGLSSHVLFTGKRPDVKDILSISDLFVLPTHNKGRREGSPVSSLEAMASGVPLIGTRVPGLRDQLAGLPGQLVAPDNPRELARRMMVMLRVSEEKNQEVIERQLARVQKNYLIDTEVERHEQFYYNLFHRRAGQLVKQPAVPVKTS